MKTRDLITLHFRLECVAVSPAHDLVPIPCPNPDRIPRFYIAQHTDDGAVSRFFRHDLPKGVRHGLAALSDREAVRNHDLVRRLLAAHAECDHVHYGKSYIGRAAFPPTDYPNVVHLDERYRGLIEQYDARINRSRWAVFAVILEGRIVSTCESSREDEAAAESWVRTLPECRGRGFARQVTAAWIAHALAQGKVPFYSHRVDNVASEGVARSLGLAQFITDTAYA